MPLSTLYLRPRPRKAEPSRRQRDRKQATTMCVYINTYYVVWATLLVLPLDQTAWLANAMVQGYRCLVRAAYRLHGSPLHMGPHAYLTSQQVCAKRRNAKSQLLRGR